MTLPSGSQAKLRAAAEEQQRQWQQVTGECERQIVSLEARARLLSGSGVVMSHIAAVITMTCGMLTWSAAADAPAASLYL